VRRTGDLILPVELSFRRVLSGSEMDFNKVASLVVLIIAASVMLVGVLVMVGLLVPVYFPEQYRIIMGVVVFLYGLYRFVLSYVRLKGREQ